MKKQIWKGSILYDSNYITLWKRPNSSKTKTGDGKKKISDFQGWARKDKEAEHRFLR